MYISDGEFMLAMARKADQRQFDREYDALLRQHAAEMRVAGLRQDLAEIEASHLRVEMEMRLKLEEVITRITADYGKPLPARIVLALRGKLNADLREVGIEPSRQDPEADRAWEQAVIDYHNNRVSSLASEAGLKLAPGTMSKAFDLYANSPKRTKKQRQRLDEKLNDLLDPRWRESQRRIDEGVLDACLARREAARKGTTAGIAAAVLPAMFIGSSEKEKQGYIRRLLVPKFTLKERLAYHAFGKVPEWARL